MKMIKVFPQFDNGETWAVFTIVGACALISAILTHVLTQKFLTKENILKVVLAFVAGFGCSLIVAGIEMPNYAKYICILVAGLLGFCLARGNEGTIFSYSTGFLGAFLMMHGLG